MFECLREEEKGLDARQNSAVSRIGWREKKRAREKHDRVARDGVGDLVERRGVPLETRRRTVTDCLAGLFAETSEARLHGAREAREPFARRDARRRLASQFQIQHFDFLVVCLFGELGGGDGRGRLGAHGICPHFGLA